MYKLLVVIGFLTIVASWFLFYGNQEMSNSLPEKLLSSYENTQFSIVYPSDMRVDEGYVYQALGPGKDIGGVSFTIPEEYREGTNLSRDTRLSIEALPKKDRCAPEDFIYDVGEKETIVINGRVYTHVFTSGAGAGNRYDEHVYILEDRPCTGIRYYIHSTNIGNYEEGTITAFDQGALMDMFDAMRDSIVFR